jgi:hypothetical protein
MPVGMPGGKGIRQKDETVGKGGLGVLALHEITPTNAY